MTLETDRGSLVLLVKPHSLKFKGQSFRKGYPFGFFRILKYDGTFDTLHFQCINPFPNMKFSEKELEKHIENGWFKIGKYNDFWE